jgi:hypothetical protein
MDEGSPQKTWRPSPGVERPFLQAGMSRQRAAEIIAWYMGLKVDHSDHELKTYLALGLDDKNFNAARITLGWKPKSSHLEELVALGYCRQTINELAEEFVAVAPRLEKIIHPSSYFVGWVKKRYHNNVITTRWGWYPSPATVFWLIRVVGLTEGEINEVVEFARRTVGSSSYSLMARERFIEMVKVVLGPHKLALAK